MNGSGTFFGYRVEARLDYHEPRVIAGMLMDNRWRELGFVKSPIGVPRGPAFHAGILESTYCYDYAAAQALRWWFHAEAERDGGALCLDTRLVKYKITYSHAAERDSEHEMIGGDDRSNIMPDWGKPKNTEQRT